MAKDKKNRSKNSRNKVTAKQRQDLRDTADESYKSRKALTEGLIGSQQIDTENLYDEDLLTLHRLVKPYYDPQKLKTVVDNSGVLPQCVDAMVKNVDGFGYILQYIGEPEKENDDDVLAERVNLAAFFDQVNEYQSFKTVRMDVREDIEETGNGYYEVIRFNDETLACIYHMKSKYVRLQVLQEESTEIKVRLFRNGELQDVSIKRRFRKFVMTTSKSIINIKWFKEFGDPRKMCADTGYYEGDQELQGKEVTNEASEVIHNKLGTETYGIPRWSGQILTIMGMNSADYVNWDLFENQVVPPMCVMVSGGTLTNESIKDIKNILLRKRGLENFNKVLILEAQSEGNITDKSATKIEIKEMSAARKEDAMFVQYTDKGDNRVRSSFRLPPLYVGRADNYSRSTADSARMIAEEQVFVPERARFDELVNTMIMPVLGAQYWTFVSAGPRLITGEELVTGFKEFSRFGVFTINEGIRLANRVLGMDITTYSEKWADYPISIVLELAKSGNLSEIDEISTFSSGLVKILSDQKFDSNEEIVNVVSDLTTLRESLRKISEERTKEKDKEFNDNDVEESEEDG